MVAQELIIIGDQGLGSVNPTTAAALLLLSSSQLYFSLTFQQKFIVRVCFFLLISVIGIGTIKLLSIASGVEFFIDKFLFINRLSPEILLNVKRGMALFACVNFILMGTSVFLSLSTKIVHKKLALWISLIVFANSLFTIIGYLFHSQQFALLFSYTPMALFSTICFEFSAISVLSLNSNVGFMKNLTSKFSGGKTARVLIPASIIAPVLLGAWALRVYSNHTMAVELMVSYLITTIIFIFFVLIWYMGVSINNFEIKQRESEKKYTEHLESEVSERTKQLFKNEKLFRALIENGTDVKALNDADGKIIYLSPSFEKTTGFSIAETLGKSAFDIMHPEQALESKNRLADVINNPGKVFHRINRFKCKDGSYIWCEGTVVNMLHDEDIKAIVSDYRNINDKKTAEDALKRSEQIFRSLIENGSDIVTLLNETGEIKYISPSFEKYSGYTQAETIGKRIFDFTIPDAVMPLKDAFFSLSKQPGAVVHRKSLIVKKDGGILYTEGTATNLLHDENVNAIVSNFRNVTDRKIAEEKLEQSELKFKLIIENNFEALSLTDKNRFPLYYNNSAKLIIGWDINEIKEFGSPLTLVHPDDKEQVMAIVKKSAENPLVNFSSTHRFKHKNGHYIWVEVTFNNMLDVDGVNANVTHLRDVTDKKIAEEKIKNINEELEEKVEKRTLQLQQINSELEMFTSIVSHDLRTPLTAIDGFANLLNSFHVDELSEDAKDYVKQIMEASTRMNNLISDLLKLSRIGKTAIKKTEIDTNLLIKKVLLNYEKTYRHHAQIIIESLPKIFIDESLMEQVWLNLISNAIKYSSKVNSPIIKIGFAEHPTEYEFFITDNGAGFDAQKATKLFKVFQRLHSNSDFEGTGVGLAIVKSIIEKHDGKIWADSQPNNGATFKFTIPKI
jgi:PAS domain S-box-containing protein